MAGKKPFALTGANALIKLGDKVLAYATDFSFQATIDVLPVEVMGRIEIVSFEPVSSRVQGSFSVIRYADGTSLPDGTTSANGNSMANMGFENHLNPKDIIASQTFDITVFSTKIVDGKVAANNTLIKIIDARVTGLAGNINKRSLLTENFQFVGNLVGDTAEANFAYTDIAADSI
jgi:hypothetical protein